LPGKVTVRGLPGAMRRDATAGSAFDSELSRRQDRSARGGRPGRSGRRGHMWVRDGGSRLAAGAGSGAAAAAPRRASLTQRQRAWSPPSSGEAPWRPQPPAAGTPAVHRCPQGSVLPEPSQGRKAWRAEGVPLIDSEETPHHARASTGRPPSSVHRPPCRVHRASRCPRARLVQRAGNGPASNQCDLRHNRVGLADYNGRQRTPAAFNGR